MAVVGGAGPPTGKARAFAGLRSRSPVPVPGEIARLPFFAAVAQWQSNPLPSRPGLLQVQVLPAAPYSFGHCAKRCSATLLASINPGVA